MLPSLVSRGQCLYLDNGNYVKGFLQFNKNIQNVFNYLTIIVSIYDTHKSKKTN